MNSWNFFHTMSIASGCRNLSSPADAMIQRAATRVVLKLVNSSESVASSSEATSVKTEAVRG